MELTKVIKKNKFQVNKSDITIGDIHTISLHNLHLSPQYSSRQPISLKYRKQHIGEQTGHKVPIISPSRLLEANGSSQGPTCPRDRRSAKLCPEIPIAFDYQLKSQIINLKSSSVYQVNLCSLSAKPVCAVNLCQKLLQRSSL